MGSDKRPKVPTTGWILVEKQRLLAGLLSSMTGSARDNATMTTKELKEIDTKTHHVDIIVRLEHTVARLRAQLYGVQRLDNMSTVCTQVHRGDKRMKVTS